MKMVLVGNVNVDGSVRCTLLSVECQEFLPLHRVFMRRYNFPTTAKLPKKITFVDEKTALQFIGQQKGEEVRLSPLWLTDRWSG